MAGAAGGVTPARHGQEMDTAGPAGLSRYWPPVRAGCRAGSQVRGSPLGWDEVVQSATEVLPPIVWGCDSSAGSRRTSVRCVMVAAGLVLYYDSWPTGGKREGVTLGGLRPKARLGWEGCYDR